MAEIKPIILLPKKKDSHSQVLEYGRNVESGVGGNPDVFATPIPPLADLKLELDEYEAMIPADIDISTAINSKLNIKREKIMGLLKASAAYVTFIANGSRAIMKLSGHKLNKENSESQTVTKIGIEYVKAGPSAGTALVKISDRGNCIFFMVERNFGADGWRYIEGFDSIHYLLEDLPSGDNELRFTGRKGKKKSPNSVTVLVRVL